MGTTCWTKPSTRQQGKKIKKIKRIATAATTKIVIRIEKANQTVTRKNSEVRSGLARNRKTKTKIRIAIATGIEARTKTRATTKRAKEVAATGIRIVIGIVIGIVTAAAMTTRRE